MADVQMSDADRVLDVLKGRRGFDAWWGPIDDDIQQNIKDEMQQAIDGE